MKFCLVQHWFNFPGKNLQGAYFFWQVDYCEAPENVNSFFGDDKPVSFL